MSVCLENVVHFSKVGQYILRTELCEEENQMSYTQKKDEQQKKEHVHNHGSGFHTHDHEDNFHTHHGHEEHSREGHRHIHSMEEKKVVVNRISRAIGHLEAVKRMVERDEDCSDVLIQLAAVRAAINNTGKVVLKNHINHCIVEAVEQDDHEAIERLNEAIDKFMK